LLAVVHVLDFGLPVKAALAQPRFHHQWDPDTLRIEKALAEKIGPELERRGHRLTVVESLGATQAVAWDEKESQFTGAADPRGEGVAGGIP
jgi:gamma-glutamyltranspeptidase/glutathione hydrolase